MADDKLTGLDRWILGEFSKLAKDVCDAYDKYEFHVVYQKVSQFIAVELSAIYHDVIKDRLYTSAPGDPAPEFEAPLLDGAGTLSLDDLRGRPAMLNFWASWCKPCVEELPLLQRTHEQIAPRGGVVVGVNYKDISEDALRFARRSKITYDNLRDPDGRYAEDYASRAFPETFVIDREGRLADRRRGPVTREWLDEHLTPVLEAG